MSLEKFLQGYIDNEVNLNADGSCARTCCDYTKTKHFQCTLGTMCARAAGIECDGDIEACTDIGADGDILVNIPEHDGLRYNYIEFDHGDQTNMYGRFHYDDSNFLEPGCTRSTNLIVIP